jgi:hypothetical protein
MPRKSAKSINLSEKYAQLDHLTMILQAHVRLIGMSVETDNMLRTRDHIQRLLDEQAGNKDPELRRYRARVQRIDRTLREKARLVVSEVGDWEHYRRVLHPPPEHWWWYLDEYVAEKERQWLAEHGLRPAPAGAE